MGRCAEFLPPEMLSRDWIQVQEVGAGFLYQLIGAVKTDVTSNLSGLMFKVGDPDQQVGSSSPSGDSGTQAPFLWCTEAVLSCSSQALRAPLWGINATNMEDTDGGLSGVCPGSGARHSTHISSARISCTATPDCKRAWETCASSVPGKKSKGAVCDIQEAAGFRCEARVTLGTSL